MHTTRPYFIVITLLLMIHYAAMADDTRQVMIRITTNQPDTLGYNFTSRLSEIVYNEILVGRAKLWDSYKKDIQVSPSTLKEIEASTNTAFTKLNHIFIYEEWQREKNEITTTTLGFLFFTKNQKMEDVLYGYIDYKEVAAAMLNEPTLANANGTSNMNMDYAMQTHYFDFDIIQLGTEVCKSKDESFEKRQAYVGDRPFNIIRFPALPVSKKLVYNIEKTTTLNSDDAMAGNQLINNVEAVLMTSDWYKSISKGVNHKTGNGEISITRISVGERWIKSKDNQQVITDWMVIVTHDGALDTLKGWDINKIYLRTTDQFMLDLLRTKNFNYIITRINAQDIERSKSFYFQKALTEAPWNALNAYVNSK